MTQVSPPQLWPQEPQLSGSVLVSPQVQHAAPQTSKPTSHEKPQTPAVHVAEPDVGEGQTFPHVLQSFVSLVRSTHLPSQSVSEPQSIDPSLPDELSLPPPPS